MASEHEPDPGAAGGGGPGWLGAPSPHPDASDGLEWLPSPACAPHPGHPRRHKPHTVGSKRGHKALVFATIAMTVVVAVALVASGVAQVIAANRAVPETSAPPLPAGPAAPWHATPAVRPLHAADAGDSRGHAPGGAGTPRMAGEQLMGASS